MHRTVPYTPLCTILGLVLSWIPVFVHGPIPEKFDVLYVNGAVAVWTYYTARMLVGFLVGISTWPRRWWIRGPLCGFLAMLAPAIMVVAVPGCGYSCMAWNLSTATVLGASIAGVARVVTGRDHR